MDEKEMSLPPLPEMVTCRYCADLGIEAVYPAGTECPGCRQVIETTNATVIKPHAELVLKAEKWLKDTIGCGVTFREFVAYTTTGEIPDVIGWVNGHCILVEVKTNRGNFLSDKNKVHRHPSRSGNVLGDWRFYVTLPGVAAGSEIPDGWGLYELHGSRLIHTAGTKYSNCRIPPFHSNKRDEVAIMYSALRRLGIRGVLDRVYERIGKE